MRTFFQWLMQTPVTMDKPKPKAAKPKRTKRTKDGYNKR